jgi:hypothetical protein
VSGIMMNEYTGADITEKLHEEQWLSQLQETAHGGAERAAGSSSSSGGVSKEDVKQEVASGSAEEQTSDKQSDR